MTMYRDTNVTSVCQSFDKMANYILYSIIKKSKKHTKKCLRPSRLPVFKSYILVPEPQVIYFILKLYTCRWSGRLTLRYWHSGPGAQRAAVQPSARRYFFLIMKAIDLSRFAKHTTPSKGGRAIPNVATTKTPNKSKSTIQAKNGSFASAIQSVAADEHRSVKVVCRFRPPLKSCADEQINPAWVDVVEDSVRCYFF